VTTVPVDRGPETRGHEGIDGNGYPVYAAKRCPECGRLFDLTDETDAAEWAFGHDCDVKS
jgi:hypothetical protein